MTFIWPGYEICNTKSCMQILGVTVSSINLTYEERDGRQ